LTIIVLTGAGKGTPQSYILYDQFTTADDAPITTPRSCEPGPGTLTVTQANNCFAISSGRLNVASGGGGFYGLIGAGVAREAGRMLMASLTKSSGNDLFPLAWANSNTISFPAFVNLDHGIYDGAAGLYTASSGPSYRVVGTNTVGTVGFAIILRASGCFVIDTTNQKLLWVDSAGNTATVYPAISQIGVAGYIDNFRIPIVKWTPTPVASDSFNRTNSASLGSTDGAGAEEVGGSGLAWTVVSGGMSISGNKVAQSAGVYSYATVNTGVASVVAQVVVNDSADTSAIQGLIMREASGTGWLCGVNPNADLNTIYEWAGGGSYTLRGSAAVTISGSQNYTITAILDGDVITSYVDGAALATYASAARNNTSTLHGIHGYNSTLTYDNFVVWNRTQTGVPNV